MARDINPKSNTFISYYAELDKCKNVEQVKGTDLWKLRDNLPKIPAWSLFSLRERKRVIQDMKVLNQEVQTRVYEILNTASNGFEDILSAIKYDRHNCLFNPEILKDIIDNNDITYGEKRKAIVDVFLSNFQEIADDPAIKNQLEKISPQERKELLAIKEAFKQAETPQEKVKVLKAIKILPESHHASNFTNLCLIGADDPEFIYAVLFKIPFESQPPHPVREAFISLFFQGDSEKYEEPASYKTLERSIKTFDYGSIPTKLKEWNQKISDNPNAALRTLTPALKDLSKRLIEHTNVSIGDYFKSVFSREKSKDINARKNLAKTIPEIEKLRETLKARTKDRAHFKNVKRNCVEIGKNQNLPALRLKYRKELGKDIPLKKLDMALDNLNENSLSRVQDLIKEYGIDNEDALIKLLAIRLTHFPVLAAILSSNNYDSNQELKQFIIKLNVARSEVLRILKSYE